MNKVRVALDIMSVVGIPTIFVMVSWFAKKMITFGKQMKILMDAQQKQMRRDLTLDYHKYMDQGFIDDDDLDMWEAAYQAYHALGVNGIMDSRREALIRLNNQRKSDETCT